MYVTPEDLAPFAEISAAAAAQMIADAEAMAALAAPCLGTPTDLSAAQMAAVRSVLRRAILRWHEAGAGGVTTTQSTAGPFSESQTSDTSSTSKSLFWPSEIRSLLDICKQVTGRTGGAFGIDMVPRCGAGVHRPWCSLAFGALYCSCGSDINGGDGPLFEGAP